MDKFLAHVVFYFFVSPKLAIFLTFLFIFLILGVWPLLFGNRVRDLHAVFWGIGGLCGLFGLAFPKALYYPNIAWFKFGMLLHKIVNPIVMGVIFYGVITPYALFIRGIGKKIMPLEPDKQVDTYWTNRNPPGPKPDTMKYQF